LAEKVFSKIKSHAHCIGLRFQCLKKNPQGPFKLLRVVGFISLDLKLVDHNLQATGPGSCSSSTDSLFLLEDGRESTLANFRRINHGSSEPSGLFAGNLEEMLSQFHDDFLGFLAVAGSDCNYWALKIFIDIGLDLDLMLTGESGEEGLDISIVRVNILETAILPRQSEVDLCFSLAQQNDLTL
jgi:hypothetical protein